MLKNFYNSNILCYVYFTKVFFHKLIENMTIAFPGTNWLVEILCLIHTKGDPKWIQSMPIWDRAPWLEAENGFMSLQGMEGPRLITSHLPFQLFPRSFSSSKAKVSVKLLRNS
jgi:bile-salt sulfotransferase